MFTRRIGMLSAVGFVVVVVLGMQFIPYGRDHTNPPVVSEPSWDSPATRELAVRACYDCHSNQTVWPAYSAIAPGSWLIYHDVVEGRAVLNFSEWGRPQEEAQEAPDVVREGEMPPAPYLLLHSGARLSTAEQDQLARGLELTLGGRSKARVMNGGAAAAR